MIRNGEIVSIDGIIEISNTRWTPRRTKVDNWFFYKPINKTFSGPVFNGAAIFVIKFKDNGYGHSLPWISPLLTLPIIPPREKYLIYG